MAAKATAASNRRIGCPGGLAMPASIRSRPVYTRATDPGAIDRGVNNCSAEVTGRSATRCTMRARNRQARECPALPPRRLRGGRRTADTRGDQLVHAVAPCENGARFRSEEHTSELQSLMRTSYAVFCLKKQK